MVGIAGFGGISGFGGLSLAIDFWFGVAGWLGGQFSFAFGVDWFLRLVWMLGCAPSFGLVGVADFGGISVLVVGVSSWFQVGFGWGLWVGVWGLPLFGWCGVVNGFRTWFVGISGFLGILLLWGCCNIGFLS